mmetsp:Transcript_36221/g.79153  ORF Transcript_36221/g.79153 Transcript_36221/m.79153 type:complete len:123 (+) Transcript_36221:58-426(+)
MAHRGSAGRVLLAVASLVLAAVAYFSASASSNFVGAAAASERSAVVRNAVNFGGPKPSGGGKRRMVTDRDESSATEADKQWGKEPEAPPITPTTNTPFVVFGGILLLFTIGSIAFLASNGDF